MTTLKIDGALFISMLRYGAARLDSNRKVINDLNVFPIPDGDTGDNMFMTISSGCEAVLGDTLTEVVSSASRGMLMGARGNSGVILSRIFAGLSKGLENISSAEVSQFAVAMDAAVEEAYSAVSTPVEGTILTVLREAVGKADRGAACFEDYFRSVARHMNVSLENTPELLPVLKEAGVVDSGGAGLVCIIEGMLYGLENKSSAPEFRRVDGPSPQSTVKLDDFGPDSELEFGYCTEFLLRLQKSKIADIESFDESEIKDYLNNAGDSVVCFREGSIVKVHVHTRTPGDILSHVQRWGEFLTIKIENMTLQHNSTNIGNEFQTPSFTRRRARYGVVAVATGEGLIKTFHEAGVEEIIDGGQTMNPSTEDFINAFDRNGAETIFVLPNNSNIILAARQAAGLYDKSEIIVLPSKNIGAGYVAAASIDRECKDKGTIEENAIAAIDSVSTCMVSKAIRNTTMEGVEIKAGDYIGYESNKILTSNPDRNGTAFKAAEKTGLPAHDVALVFYGIDTPREEAEKLVSGLQKKYPRTEIILTDGGQPIYDYIIVLC